MQDSKVKKCVKQKITESCDVLEDISETVKLLMAPKEQEDGRKDDKRKTRKLRSEARVS